MMLPTPQDLAEMEAQKAQARQAAKMAKLNSFQVPSSLFQSYPVTRLSHVSLGDGELLSFDISLWLGGQK